METRIKAMVKMKEYIRNMTDTFLGGLSACLVFLTTHVNEMILIFGLFVAIIRGIDCFYDWQMNWILRKKKAQEMGINKDDYKSFYSFVFDVIKRILRFFIVIIIVAIIILLLFYK